MSQPRYATRRSYRDARLCLGAPLARLQAQEASAALRERYPRLDLAHDTLVWREPVVFRGPASLPVVSG